MSENNGGGRVVAVLGPTNTGKTHLAVERMLGHRNGMIGLPLRLLAREIYDRVAAARGASAVALITGEEKIVPAHPDYFVCTVESMPLGRRSAFVAVDEIQLAGDPERGHVFTDRLFNARGTEETMFLGAQTAARLIRRLVPEAEFVSHSRLSRLSYTAPRKLRRLPRRSAVIAFSVADVYAIAELVRRQRGGTAVVLGALSPRTRNAQVAMFEAGEVDYLVATDAIGMGLNLGLDHVAFTSLSKFDGRVIRTLRAAEIAQIAGRAGRYMNDGTFGTTAEQRPMAPQTVTDIEAHRFEPQKAFYYRNSGLDFSSLPALLRSLKAPAPRPGLVRAPEAEDERSLRALAATPAIVDKARAPARLRLLWEVCRIPDFRKTMVEAHTRLLGRIFGHLAGPDGVLPADWVARSIAGLDRHEGDVDTLATRIAHIRTWTYITHRPDWIDDPRHWQERARAVEDRLSDALHARLTQRFVDRRTAAITRRLKEKSELAASVAPDGEVLVEGHGVGRLEGFHFVPDRRGTGLEAKTLRAAANRAVAGEIGARAARLSEAGDAAFSLGSDARLRWDGALVARLAAGGGALQPAIKLLPSELDSADARERVRHRLARWLDGYIAAVLAPLRRLADDGLEGAARGIAFQLVESLGSAPRQTLAPQLAALAPRDRARLRRLGVRFGEVTVFVAATLKPRAVTLRCLLWSVHHGMGDTPPPLPGLVSLAVDERRGEGYYAAAGFRVCGARAVRIDMLEKLAGAIRARARGGPFASDHELLSLVGCGRDEFAAVMDVLGYEAVPGEGEPRYRRRRPRRAKARPRRHAASPFAALGARARAGSG